MQSETERNVTYRCCRFRDLPYPLYQPIDGARALQVNLDQRNQSRVLPWRPGQDDERFQIDTSPLEVNHQAGKRIRLARLFFDRRFISRGWAPRASDATSKPDQLGGNTHGGIETRS